MTKENENIISEVIGSEDIIENEQDGSGDLENDPDLIIPALEEEITPTDIENLKRRTPDIKEEQKIPVEIPESPKPVEGETPRERALRLQVQELREKIRSKDEVIKIAQPLISNEEYESLKEIYADEELERFEKLFDVVGKKKGYVKVEDVYKDKGQETLNAFLEQHPEYKPENDSDDHRWNLFFKILDRDYNRVGKSPAELSKLFEKVNKDVAEELGESPKRVISQRDAEIQKVRSVSHAGGTKEKEVSPVKKTLEQMDPSVRKMFKGFTDDDF